MQKQLRARRALILEMLLLYGLLPGAGFLIIRYINAPAILLLPPLTLLYIWLLWRDKSFTLRPLVTAPPKSALAAIAKTALILVPLLILSAWLIEPARFFRMPLERPQLWLTIMLAYPVISVLPQELIYRVFFFHRYAPLFKGKERLATLTNAALFAAGHIIFLNPLAIALTFLGGLLFAHRYQQSKNLWPVTLEHTLYGLLIFTTGLGIYFYSGAAMR